MKVQRLSKGALDKILGGTIKEDAICVIKFYSNGCDMCHNLKEYFETIAQDYEDLHFFAFNVDDYPMVEKQLKFNGVPTISLIKAGPRKPTIRILQEPEKPNEKTWYRVKDIKNFIERER
jgi:thiol-disulfide isomerase/thioredoxin